MDFNLKAGDRVRLDFDALARLEGVTPLRNMKPSQKLGIVVHIKPPYVVVDCAAVPPELIESEMFGHIKGAFTGASTDRKGAFEAADGGTIFIDEIGDLPGELQPRLLRVLEKQEIKRVGGNTTSTVDVRVISATNRDLRQAVADGIFREDLLYRINLITLHLPSLSQRKQDIPLLARHFLARAATVFERPDAVKTIAPEAQAWLEAQEWPGNVRQLEQFLARAVLVADGPKLDREACERATAMDAAGGDRDPLPPVGEMTMDEVEKAMIEKSLRHHGGNISKAAESLGLSRAALYRRLEKHRIPK